MRCGRCYRGFAGGTSYGSPVVSFNYALFISQFPVFNYVSEATAQTYFNVVGISYVRNDGLGTVPNANTKLYLMNCLVAHLLQLFAPTPDGAAPSTLVGRINSASEGSVNVSTEYQPMTQPAAWYLQTPYGAAYWEGMKPYRSMRYMAGPTRNFQPWPWQ